MSKMDDVASHLPLLVAAALRTTGPILELGIGFYSTPVLREIARAQGRAFTSVDHDEEWLKRFVEQPENRGVEFIFTRNWAETICGLLRPVSFSLRNWGLVFVDSGPGPERGPAVEALLGRTDAFVLHDTESLIAYGYDRALPMLKHQYTYKGCGPWTTVASNRIDVTEWLE